jgi:Rrf2 family protein
MRLTKQTGYALRILLHCALAGDRSVTAAEIARAHNITEHNVLKIMHLLANGGFIETARGRGGGIRLAHSPEAIHLGDIVRVTEQTHIEADCFGGGADCAIRPVAPINRILDEALAAFIEVLDRHTLDDLVAARPAFGRALDAGPAAARLAGGLAE